jgi:hypothetical protein
MFGECADDAVPGRLRNRAAPDAAETWRGGIEEPRGYDSGLWRRTIPLPCGPSLVGSVAATGYPNRHLASRIARAVNELMSPYRRTVFRSALCVGYLAAVRYAYGYAAVCNADLEYTTGVCMGGGRG